MRLHVLVGGQLFWRQDPGPLSAILTLLHEAVQRFLKDLHSRLATPIGRKVQHPDHGRCWGFIERGVVAWFLSFMRIP
jgi:hypothetical protein